ncbi:MAG: ATP synthase F1 subunit delta [Planctomycetota bacterium]
MLDPVTNRYTEALFNLARRAGALDAVRLDVERLAATLDSPAVAGFFFDARVSLATRRAKMEPLLAGMHDLTRSFVRLLFAKRRESVLAGLREAFHRRDLEERGEAEGRVESARPLSAGDVAELAVAMGTRIGRRVTLENRIVPELIGGARIIVGSKMVDGSLQGRLEGLRRRLLDAPLPAI